MATIEKSTGEGPAATGKAGKEHGVSYRDLWSRPGYLVRRLHQIHVGLFAEECADKDLTPVQFAMLSVLYGVQGLDQFSLSTSVGVDRTSGADVIKRLVRRGLLVRERSELDRRANIVRITPAGRTFVDQMRPAMERAQNRLIEPLSEGERDLFLEMIRKMVEANNSASRAPMG